MVRKHPAEVREYIKANYKGTSYKDMACRVSEKFSYEMSVKQVKCFYHNNRLNSGLTGRFEKGHEPWSKGKKGLHVSKTTEFKKGHTPVNHREVGAERICSKDGYVLIKVAEPNVWRQKHRVVWEQANGKKIPKGHVVIFLDGDKLNLDPDNLMCISQAEHRFLNVDKLRTHSKELTKAGVKIAKLKVAVAERSKKKRNEEV